MTSPGRYSTPPTTADESPVSYDDQAPARSRGRYVRLALLLAVLALLLWGGLKAWRVSQAAQSLLAVQDEAQALIAEGPQAVDPDAAEALVLGARADIVTLRDELAFLRPIAPYLGWVPRLGPTLGAAPHMLDMADAGSEAGVLAVSSLKPALAIVQSDGFGVARLGDLLPTLSTAGPALDSAGAALDRYDAARARLGAAVAVEALPWRVRQLLEQADQWLPLARNGLSLAPHLPALLGANGPRRYLLMAQNEDEIRATGGFLTGAGVVTVENGRIIDLSFKDANQVDNYAAKPYDFPPQPLYDYMRLEMFLFRDANYWPDFPTSAQKAMDLYVYGQDALPLDGAVAIDQEFLRLLLDATGPVPVAGSDRTINANNVIETVRAARDIQEGQEVAEWVRDRKAFLGGLAGAILAQLESGQGEIDMVKLARNMAGAADGRHLSVYLRDPAAAAALAGTGWDGRLPVAPPGDFVMAVDTNVGYNKVNLLIERGMTYEVNFNGQPRGSLSVFYRHTGEPLNEPCFQGAAEEYEQAAEYLSLANKCYWNYLRVYAPGGSVLVESTNHTVPGETLFSGQTWDSAAQQIAEQPGLATFSNLLLLARGEETAAMVTYELPEGVIEERQGENVYRLRVFKQPGLRPEFLMVDVTLPAGANVTATSLPAEVDGNRVVMNTTLDRNLDITIHFGQ